MLDKINDKKIFLTAFLATFLIHGEIIFNKISWYDDVKYVLRGWDDGLRHGRWTHAVMAGIVQKVSGMESLPVLTAAICAVCIAAIVCLLLDLFQIKNDKAKFALILVFCSIPAVAGHFGYMVSAGYDFIGKLFCTIAGYIVCKKKSMLSFCGAAILFACSLGEYQCYVAFYLAILLIYFTMEVLENNCTWKMFWLNAFYYVGSAIAGLLLYLLILQMFLNISGMQLTSYAGTDTYGIVNISEYINRVVFAYRDFINPTMGARFNMFPFHWKGWHAGLLFGLFGLMALIIIGQFRQKQYSQLGQCIIAFGLLPLALNFNFILYGSGSMHSLHVYHIVLLFLYLFVLVKGIIKLSATMIDNEKVLGILKKSICGITTTVVLVFGLLYIRYDNYCYLQAEMRQEAAISYFTTLITKIQSVEGYDDDYSVIFINEFQKRNNVDEIITRYDPIVINPYYAEIINSYNWDDFMNRWCGYDPSIGNPVEYENHELVQKMPSYPDDGSIQIIDDVVVVKF